MKKELSQPVVFLLGASFFIAGVSLIFIGVPMLMGKGTVSIGK